ncbi:MAG: NADP-dependent malic enzyme, partial [Porphyromonadaceae bacterium]|nr:NADP-dependent malic enzyme [Porphyromonadaceae bacterium]
VKPENVVMVDSKGVINDKRTDLNEVKKQFVTHRNISTLAEAMKGADMFLGLSRADVLTPEMVQSMNDKPIVFALANPNPEISYDKAKASRPDLIFATGRSDYPNQINNVLGFPYIFRGALDVHATCINEEMKLAAAYAIAKLTKARVPDVVNAAYGLTSIHFGPDYIIPKALDPRLLTTVAPAVAKAAIESGVARRKIYDWGAYQNKLEALMGYDNKMLRNFTDMAKRSPKRVVFAEANHINMLTAAVMAYQEGVCHPILLGNADFIKNLAREAGLSLEGIEIVSLRSEAEINRRRHYAHILAMKRKREGITPNEAYEKMFDRNYFGMMMVECGDADAFITGTYTKYTETIQIAKDVIGIREGHTHFGTMHILTTPKGTFFLADTLINRHPNTDTLVDIAKLSSETLKFFALEPKIAMLSYSNFGADKIGSPSLVHEAVAIMQREYPDLAIDGEMQVHFALNRELRDRMFPFSRLAGKDVNTLIFPNLSSANSAYKLLLEMGVGSIIGPIQMGLNKPIHFTDVESAPRDIVNLTTVAVVDAIVESTKK